MPAPALRVFLAFAPVLAAAALAGCADAPPPGAPIQAAASAPAVTGPGMPIPSAQNPLVIVRARVNPSPLLAKPGYDFVDGSVLVYFSGPAPRAGRVNVTGIRPGWQMSTSFGGASFEAGQTMVQVKISFMATKGGPIPMYVFMAGQPESSGFQTTAYLQKN